MHDFYRGYINHLNDTLNALDIQQLQALTELIIRTRDAGHTIFMLGNGGSAAAASHWVTDFVKGASVPGQPRMKMISPIDQISLVSALGNDISFDDAFSEQLKAYMQPGDVLIALSVSGSSPNLMRAFEYGKQHGATTVAIIGDMDGKLKPLSDMVITIPSKNYGVVEDIHMAIDHMISQYVKELNLAAKS